MTTFRAVAAVMLAASLIATPAHAYLASNGLRVQQLNQTDFVVRFGVVSGPTSFWCAAGDFVIQRLRLAPGTRVFRLSAPPRLSGQDVLFSLNAEGAQERGVLVMGSKDEGMSASLAQTFCANDPLPYFWFLD